jgi:hypothetical protein
MATVTSTVATDPIEDLARALAEYLDSAETTEFPRPPATQAEWIKDVGGAIGIVQAQALYTDIAVRNTRDFQEAVQPFFDRSKERLRIMKETILSSRPHAAYDLTRPRDFWKLRWSQSPYGVVLSELENFRLADPDAPEGSHEATDGGTSPLHRIFWFVVINGSYLVPGAVAVRQGDKLLEVILAGNLTYALSITTGMAVEPLSNFGVMFNTFKDWVPWLVFPSLFQIDPSFNPENNYLLTSVGYIGGTTAGGLSLLLLAYYGRQWGKRLSTFLWKTADPSITDAEGKAALLELLEGIKMDQKDANDIYNTFVKKNPGWLGDQSRIRAAASQAMSQWNNAVGMLSSALRKAGGLPERPDPVFKLPGEQWTQWGMWFFATLLLGCRTGTGSVELLFALSVGTFSVYASLKMWSTTGGVNIPFLRGDPNKRGADTRASFNNLAAPALPLIAVALGNLLPKLQTGQEGLADPVAFTVSLIGLASINLTVRTHIGPVGTYACLSLLKYLSGGRLDPFPKEDTGNTPAVVRATTRLNAAVADEITAFLRDHVDWSRIHPEPIPDDPANPTPAEVHALAEWQSTAETELRSQAAGYLLPMLTAAQPATTPNVALPDPIVLYGPGATHDEYDEIDDDGGDHHDGSVHSGEHRLALRFDPLAFLDHFHAFAMPALVRHRNAAAAQKAAPILVYHENKDLVLYGPAATHGEDDEIDDNEGDDRNGSVPSTNHRL